MILYIEILLWLFVMNIGIAFGAGIYEARIIIPEWVKSPSTYRWPDSGKKFWAFVTTVPLTILCLANLVAAWLFNGVGSDVWLASAIIIAMERVFTFTYFIPNVLKIEQGSESIRKPQLKRMVTHWMYLNYIRIIMTLIAWILALEAFSLII